MTSSQTSRPPKALTLAGLFRASTWRWLGRMARNRTERIVFYQPLFLFVSAVIIGVLCGLASVGFHHLIGFFAEIFWGMHDITVEGLRSVNWWMLALIPALGGLIVGPVIHFLAPEARGHGVPEVMLAVARDNGVMRGRVVIGKALASALTISSGGSAGREGPIIQIGAAVGSKIGQLLRASGQHLRTFAGCGAAAGLAATFNAPIAATLFTVEVIIGEYSVLQFTPIVISAVIATVVSRTYWGNDEPVFRVPEYELVSSWEFGPYIMLGLLSGFLALALMKLLFKVEDFAARQTRIPAMLKPAVGGLLLGLIGLGLPQIYADGYGTVDAVLHGNLAWWLVLLLIVGKLAGTSLTLGSGGSGGVFMPALFLGAMLGSAVGELSGLMLGEQAGGPGAYALVGMGGIVAGAMHAPITAMIMMFELTGNYAIILPLMTVCILSTLVTNLVQRESIYTEKLARHGIDLFRGRTLDIFRELKVSSCMLADPPVIDSGAPAEKVIEYIMRVDSGVLYALDEQGGLTGTIRLQDLKHVLMKPGGIGHGILAMDLADTRAPVCHPAETLRDASIKFERSGLTELPVVDPENGKLIGRLPYAELIAHYNEEVFRRDTGDTLARRMSSDQRFDKIPVAPGFALRTWRPPPLFWGKTMIEAELPQRYNVHAILLRRHAEPTIGSRDKPLDIIRPARDTVIESGDQLIVCGRDEDVESLPG